ncbi:hypothetical protein [Anaerovorax odorimutans]|uniref:hypothetical protein n=1 Tax=Anaerovorax odorimutans TaxID=109327 RepID=UPI0003FD6884|nr:hypothetical protein [Anaerovorax odorimutans]
MKNNNDKNTQNSYLVNIGGNTTGVQIQQNAVDSNQSQIINEKFDYKKVANILDEISKFKPMFKDTYGETADEANEILEIAMEAVNKQDHPSKIKSALNRLKDLTLGVSSSLIATGILGLLTQLGM